MTGLEISATGSDTDREYSTLSEVFYRKNDTFFRFQIDFEMSGKSFYAF